MKEMPQMTVADVLALPVAVDLETAGRAFGFGRTKSHEMARAEPPEFPCRVLRIGGRYRVLRADLLAALGLEDAAPEPGGPQRAA